MAAEAGADDVVNDDGTIIVYTPREKLGAVEHALTSNQVEIEDSMLKWSAKSENEIDAEKVLQNLRLMNTIEELDDVQSVSSNMMITDDAIAAFETA